MQKSFEFFSFEKDIVFIKNSKSDKNYPLTTEKAELGAFDFDEKVQVLDAIRQNYNFEEKFKSDYRILKENGVVDPESRAFPPILCTRNLKIVNQYDVVFYKRSKMIVFKRRGI